MTRYLLAAEADRIQDLLFRSSRLREVVGGSQLLTRFCKETPARLGVGEQDIVISDGGSFRILFDDEVAARVFGEHLAEVYRLATGASLSVAEPVAVNGNFGHASERAEQNLRRAKLWRNDWQSQEHLPYAAFCESCGVGLAVTHDARYQNEEAQDLCQSCLTKSAERGVQVAADPQSFLGMFFSSISTQESYDWPGSKIRRRRSERDPVEDIADYDARRYVAYLLADGNQMGAVFAACETSDQMRRLSNGLSDVLRKALAEPAGLAMQKHGLSDRPGFVPVLPLILGGDDLFALIPAPWALDFARRFCEAYEREMKELLKGIGLENMPAPSVSATVVICKSKHPFMLAHQAGEQRLKEAKQMAKCLNRDAPPSTVNFEVVIGGRLVDDPLRGRIRRTLRPYWLCNPNPEWGLSIQALLNQRLNLSTLPNKRLAELQSLYDELPPSLNARDLEPWRQRLLQFLERVGAGDKTDQGATRKRVEGVLTSLGDGPQGAFWRKVSRDNDTWHGHGLPDLLEAWDYAHSLDKPLDDYEEEAE